jgi:hypothetical protein
LRIPGHRTSDLGPRLGTALAVLALCAACGKKGPPLAPLNLAPEAPKAVTARRLGDSVYLQMTVPDHGMTGRGAFSVDHIDVYAITVEAGHPIPANRDFLKPEHVIGQIPVQPPLDPDAPAPDPPDPRPLPGATTTFVEKLTEAQLAPSVVKIKPQPAPRPQTPPRSKRGAEPSSEPAPPPAPVGPQVLTRVYVVEGVPKGGRGFMPSPRLEVPLLLAPGAPRPGTPTADETSVTLTWQPPPSTTDELPGVLYNVYGAPPSATVPADAPAEQRSAPQPLNDKPLAEQLFTHRGAEAGKEQCFVVRSVAAVGTTSIESEPTAPICITPKDTFPPAAPKGLAAVASAGVINLIWDANTEPDLAGYLVLRGEAPSDTLRPLMAEPMKETRYADRSARPGVRYLYEIIAVDKAGNRSGPSSRVEEAAR